MNDNIILYLTFLAVYLLDTFISVTGNTVILYSHFYRWEYRFSHKLVRLRNRFVFFANPFPPLGVYMTANNAPVMFSDTGCCAVETEKNFKNQKPLFYKYSDIKTLRKNDKKIVINGSLFYCFDSEKLACYYYEKLQNLIEAGIELRQKTLKQMIDGMFCIQESSDLVLVVKRKTRLLKICANLLCVYLFVLVPVSTFFVELVRSWFFLASVLIVLVSGISVIYLVVYKNLYKTHSSNLWSDLIMIILFPPAAIRSVDHLLRDLFVQQNPVVVARALLSPGTYRDFLGEYLRSVHFRQRWRDEHDYEQIIDYYNTLLLEKMRVYLQKDSLLIDDFLNGPEPENEDSLAYCPCCHAQYTRTEGDCSDCGIALQEFK